MDVLVAERLPILSQEIEGVVVGELLLAEETHHALHAAPLRRGDPMPHGSGIHAADRISRAACAEDELFARACSPEADHSLKPSMPTLLARYRRSPAGTKTPLSPLSTTGWGTQGNWRSEPEPGRVLRPLAGGSWPSGWSLPIRDGGASL